MLLLAALLLQSNLSLEVSPKYDFLWDGKEAARFTFLIRAPRTPGFICNGWIYPIQGAEPEHWPSRRSCKEADASLYLEIWGEDCIEGYCRGYGFPYPGIYVAFVEFYPPEGEPLRASQTFQILEGIPR